MAGQSLNSLWVTGEENGFPRPFGNYLLLAAFAKGGMGELFLAMNGSIAGAFRLCVVKKLRGDLTNDREYVNRFVDEARVVVQLNHANISHVFDIGRIDGQYYLAMEYVSGVSLKRLMSRAEELKTVLPEDLAIFIAREVLEALDYAHQHTHPITGEPLNVVHRDVSPQNVLVSWAGEVKLIDFGLALSVLKDEHTATGAVMGKVAYMPPEQARGDEVGAACDQFATAIITYEMLAGDRYHGDLPPHAIWAVAGMGNFPPPKWSKLPKELQVVLQRALHNDPFKRYPTCGDLRDSLGGYMAAHHPATSERTLRELLDKWFKEYRAEERELLSRFKDVTGAKIREAVKSTAVSTESLVSGTHQRPIEWQMPPTEPDARGASGPSPLSLAPLLPKSDAVLPQSRLDESQSMRLMPPPPLLSPPAGQLADAAAALVAQNGTPVLPAPVPAPLQWASMIESARLNASPSAAAAAANAAAAAAAANAAAAAAMGIQVPEPTGVARLNGPGALAAPQILRPSSPEPQLAPPLLAPPQPAPAQPAPPLAEPAVPATAPKVSARAPAGVRRESPSPTEPTERVRPRNDEEPLEFDPSRRSVWPLAAAAVLGLALVTVVIILVTRTDPTTVAVPVPPTASAPVIESAPPLSAAPPLSTAPLSVPPPLSTAPHSAPHTVKAHPPTTSPASAPPSAAPPDEGESKEAKRARDRVASLKRSACKDPCVAGIVGQLETMPGAVELDGFRTSVDSCIAACSAK